MNKIVNNKQKRKPLSSLFLGILRQEWKIWLAIAVVILLTFIFSNQLSIWLKDSTFIQVLDSLSKLGLLIAAVAFLREIPKWEERSNEEVKRRRLEYWKVVDAAKIAREASPDGRFSSHALKIALECLAEEKDAEGKSVRIGPFEVVGANLYEINLENSSLYVAGFKDTDLSKARFCNSTINIAYFTRARIFGTDFRGASWCDISFRHALYNDETQFPEGFDLKQARAYRIGRKANLQEAMLFGAMLWDADLEEANLQGADLRGAIIGGENSNLKNANLQNANLWRARAGKADLRGAVLCNASLREANLEEAKLDDADLYGADLSEARNITVKQIKAAKNWEKAIYDNNFSRELGLSL